ncbi:Response regulator receiver domain-containing protein [Paenibacillus sp. UNC496MF]|uniref:response regulator n=1 Tax=Paenibacillus sp. UNC496MF TaxID=1502753 RepID=UPI0008EB12CF|nr:response regulator [Paenibacillus sp. UNC496MF]SFI32872.1 Response regulator receiver domain-containing protein [Paenibacillus sp. UNC496MF]
MVYVLVSLLVLLGILLFAARRRRDERNKPAIANRGAADPRRPKPPETSGREIGASGEPAGGVRRVLIVDDQPLIRTMLAELFEREGATVSQALNGASAIDAVRSGGIDHVLLDLKLPDMDGIEALRAIRRLDDRVPVSLMTGYGSPEQLAEAERLGIGACFMKPFDLQQVKRHVLGGANDAGIDAGEFS